MDKEIYLEYIVQKPNIYTHPRPSPVLTAQLRANANLEWLQKMKRPTNNRSAIILETSRSTVHFLKLQGHSSTQ
jgi:hypothetical protein